MTNSIYDLTGVSPYILLVHSFISLFFLFLPVLEFKLYGDRDFYLFYSLVYLKQLEQCLAHSR